jgi:hypothetical protein
MLIPLGILASAGGVPPIVSDYELISTTLISSNTPSVTFDVSSFTSTYKHLQIRGVFKYDGTSATDFYLRFNGDTASNYSHHRFLGNGSAVSAVASANTSQAFIGFIGSQFGAMVLDILEPYSTNKNKTTRSLVGSHGADVREVMMTSADWRNTNSVTSITIFPLTPWNMVAGSRLSIYGIRG